MIFIRCVDPEIANLNLKIFHFVVFSLYIFAAKLFLYRATALNNVLCRRFFINLLCTIEIFNGVLGCRSPSPEPIYSHDGKRLNTREYRTRKNLEEERHALILRMQTIFPDFKPPADYK